MAKKKLVGEYNLYYSIFNSEYGKEHQVEGLFDSNGKEIMGGDMCYSSFREMMDDVKYVIKQRQGGIEL